MRTTIEFKLDKDDPFLQKLRKDINSIPFSYDYPRSSQHVSFHQGIFNATFEALSLELLSSKTFASIDRQRELLKAKATGKEIYTFITDDYSYFGERLKEQLDLFFNRQLHPFYMDKIVKTIGNSIVEYGQLQLNPTSEISTPKKLKR